MFSLIRLCKVEGLSRNWQDIHHEQGGKLLRLLRKENWVWNAKIWLDRKLKLLCCSCHLLLATPWQVWLFQGVGIQRLLCFKDLKWLLLTFNGIILCRFCLCLPETQSGNSSPRSFRWKNHMDSMATPKSSGYSPYPRSSRHCHVLEPLQKSQTPWKRLFRQATGFPKLKKMS